MYGPPLPEPTVAQRRHQCQTAGFHITAGIPWGGPGDRTRQRLDQRVVCDVCGIARTIVGDGRSRHYRYEYETGT